MLALWLHGAYDQAVQSWFEDFGGPVYAITVTGQGVTIGYRGRVVGAGRWDGTSLHLTFSRPHFYGKANADADPAFIANLTKRIAARLSNG